MTSIYLANNRYHCAEFRKPIDYNVRVYALDLADALERGLDNIENTESECYQRGHEGCYGRVLSATNARTLRG